LSAILASSALAFAIARWAGVAYLVYLAVGALRSAPDPSGARARLALSAWRSCWNAFFPHRHFASEERPTELWKAWSHSDNAW
jgi:threonine/homoserine/homoserine lactone efflux protein